MGGTHMEKVVLPALELQKTYGRSTVLVSLLLPSHSPLRCLTLDAIFANCSALLSMFCLARARSSDISRVTKHMKRSQAAWIESECACSVCAAHSDTVTQSVPRTVTRGTE